MSNYYLTKLEQGIIIRLKMSGMIDTRVEDALKQNNLTGTRWTINRVWKK